MLSGRIRGRPGIAERPPGLSWRSARTSKMNKINTGDMFMLSGARPTTQPYEKKSLRAAWPGGMRRAINPPPPPKSGWQSVLDSKPISATRSQFFFLLSYFILATWRQKKQKATKKTKRRRLKKQEQGDKKNKKATKKTVEGDKKNSVPVITLDTSVDVA